MILKTIESNTYTQKKVTIEPIENYKILYNGIENQRIQPSQKPNIQFQNKKRLLDYKDNINNTNIQQTRSQMSRSTLARMNRELQQKNNMISKYGKFDSKWTQQHMDNFGANSRLSVRDDLQKRSVRSSGYSQHKNIGNQQLYRPHPMTQRVNFVHPAPPSPVIQIPPIQHFHAPPPQYNFVTIPQNTNPQPVYSSNIGNPQFRDIQRQSSQYNRFNQNSQDYQMQRPHRVQYQDRRYNQSYRPQYDQARENLHQAKEIVKNQARETKNQIKQNVKGNVRAAVGHQNYQLMSDAKDAVGQVASNVKQGIKQNVQQTFGDVYYTAKQAKNQIKGVALQAKQSIKEGTKQTVKAAVGHQNFNLLKYISQLMGQLKANLFGSSDKKLKQAQKANKSLVYEKNYISNPVKRNQTLNQVSPIEYSQRTFSRTPTQIADLASIWIYAFILIGVFLVIFQLMK